MEDGDYWGDFGAIRIWKTNDDGDYEVVSTIERSGALLESRLAGISRVVTLDFNKDGLKDILVFLEVHYIDDSAEYEGLSAAFELYENHGNYEFTRVTETVFEGNKIFEDEFSAKDYEIVDVNNDGLDDIVLQIGGQGLEYVGFDHSSQQGYINIGSAILLNVNGRRFKHLVDNTNLTIPINDFWNMPTWTGFRVQVSDDENNVSKLYGMNNNGTPIIIRIEEQ